MNKAGAGMFCTGSGTRLGKKENAMSASPGGARTSVADIRARKGSGKPLVCLTAYQANISRLLDQHVDILLVGDSLGMVVYGMETTQRVTLDMMIAHGLAVAGNTSHALTVVDMPRGSYEESPGVALENALRLLQETGCSAVKLEGGVSRAETVQYMVQNGVSVMGHIGLLPQNALTSGDFRIVGRSTGEWNALEEDARALDDSGVFAMVLEGMVEPLARRISVLTSVPTIGIGASLHCDGQILVTEDMLGLTGKSFRFVKEYAALDKAVTAAVEKYAKDVRARRFPGTEHTYTAAKCKQLPEPGGRWNEFEARKEVKKAARNG